MKRSRFTESQIAGILKEALRRFAVNELCRQHQISGAPYYKWKSKQGGLRETSSLGLSEAV